MLDHESQQAAEEPAEFNFSIGRILAALRRRWWVLAVAVAVAGLVAAGILASIPNRYSAVALVQVEPRDKKIAPVESVIPGLKGDTVTIESEVEALRARTLLLGVIERLGLRQDPEFGGIDPFKELFAGPGAETSAPGALQETPAAGAGAGEAAPPARDWVLANVAASLAVRRVRNTLVMAVEFTSTSPAKAAKIANAIADAYIAQQLEAKQEAQRHATTMLDERVAVLAEKLARSEGRLAAFMSSNNIYIAEGHEIAERQLTREMEGIVRAQAEVAQTRARYLKAQQMMREGADLESVSDVLNNHTVRQLREGLAKAELRMAEARTRLGPKHPVMAQIRAELALAKRTLRNEVGKIITNLRQEHDIALAREKNLEAKLAALKERINASKVQQVQLRHVTREVDATRELYEALLARSKQTAATAGLQYSDSSILEYAGEPLTAIGPKRKKFLVVILILAFAASAMGVIAIEFLEKGFADPKEVERVLDLDTIAAFPVWPGGSAGARAVWHGAQLAANPMSEIAESTRQLRHELDGLAPRDTARVVLVASALAEEGRSHVATSLAYSYAASGKRTLLIDGDLRFGLLSEALGLAGRAGLLDALAHEANAFDTILSETTSGLSFLPAMARRRRDVSAPELLAGPRFGRLTRELKSEFEVIVIDAPPLLPIVDGRAMAAMADQIAFVTTWRRTPKMLARRALETLGRDEDKVAGVVVNEIEGSDFKRLYSYRGRAGGGTQSTAA